HDWLRLEIRLGARLRRIPLDHGWRLRPWQRRRRSNQHRAWLPCNLHADRRRSVCDLYPATHRLSTWQAHNDPDRRRARRAPEERGDHLKVAVPTTTVERKLIARVLRHLRDRLQRRLGIVIPIE